MLVITNDFSKDDLESSVDLINEIIFQVFPQFRTLDAIYDGGGNLTFVLHRGLLSPVFVCNFSDIAWVIDLDNSDCNVIY